MEGVYKSTGKEPSALAKKPELFVYIYDFYQAFLTLYRNKSGADTLIRISEIAAYAQLFPELNDNEMLVLVVTTAEQACLDYQVVKSGNNKDGKAIDNN